MLSSLESSGSDDCLLLDSHVATSPPPPVFWRSPLDVREGPGGVLRTPQSTYLNCAALLENQDSENRVAVPFASRERVTATVDGRTDSGRQENSRRVAAVEVSELVAVIGNQWPMKSLKDEIVGGDSSALQFRAMSNHGIATPTSNAVVERRPSFHPLNNQSSFDNHGYTLSTSTTASSPQTPTFVSKDVKMRHTTNWMGNMRLKGEPSTGASIVSGDFAAGGKYWDQVSGRHRDEISTERATDLSDEKESVADLFPLHDDDDDLRGDAMELSVVDNGTKDLLLESGEEPFKHDSSNTKRSGRLGRFKFPSSKKSLQDRGSLLTSSHAGYVSLVDTNSSIEEDRGFNVIDNSESDRSSKQSRQRQSVKMGEMGNSDDGVSSICCPSCSSQFEVELSNRSNYKRPPDVSPGLIPDGAIYRYTNGDWRPLFRKRSTGGHNSDGREIETDEAANCADDESASRDRRGNSFAVAHRQTSGESGDLVDEFGIPVTLPVEERDRWLARNSLLPEEESLEKFSHRAGWLIGLLVVQSTSSFVLQGFKPLIDRHAAVMYFLTMLVGAGGNAGSQSTVLVIRSLALGKLNRRSKIIKFLLKQMRIGLGLASVLFLVSFFRVYLFDGDGFEVLAVGVSLFVIVVTSVFFGSTMPLVLNYYNIDPAHAGAAIQVLMDIVGVTLTCVSSHVILNLLAPLIDPAYLTRRLPQTIIAVQQFATAPAITSH